ncbi:MAG: hypothetical protein E6240_01830 [Clostridium butyricum]|nr:hypothetical protein [Clostridium butyricum]
MLSRLSKLLSARFLVVVMLTITFCYLAIKQTLTTEFTTIYVIAINYYFYKERTKDDKN